MALEDDAPFEDGATVFEEDRKIGFEVRQWEQGTVTMYDWVDDEGNESDILYATIEEAKQAARSGNPN